MQTKHLGIHINTEGEFYPMEFDASTPRDYVIEALAALGGFLALIALIFMVFVL